jgi:hypothetical protein
MELGLQFIWAKIRLGTLMYLCPYSSVDPRLHLNELLLTQFEPEEKEFQICRF